MPRRWSVISGCLALLLAAFVPLGLNANHSWSGYHWDGSGLPVEIVVDDNLTGDWASGRYLSTAIDDWNAPLGGAPWSVWLRPGNQSTDPATCAPILGRIEVCNWAYGENGWLGLAQVWAYRGKDKHIAQATSLMNDTYFNASYAGGVYDTPAWRQLVMCQEIAHDFGLDHQDENFSNGNLGTCMDYTDDPDGTIQNQLSNLKPNQHDFDQLAEIYAHISGGGGGGGGRGGGGGGGGGGRPGGAGQAGGFRGIPDQALPRIPIDSPAQWGQLIRDNGRSAIYARDLGNNVVVFTFVTWVL
jgi:hypothetical protein